MDRTDAGTEAEPVRADAVIGDEIGWGAAVDAVDALLACVGDDCDVVIRRDGTVAGLERRGNYMTRWRHWVLPGDPAFRLTPASRPEND